MTTTTDRITGITIDVPISALEDARRFYSLVFGRTADLEPDSHTAEWILTNDPQIAVRLVESPPSMSIRVGIGVADVEAERERLAAVIDKAPPVDVHPGVIALLELRDPDGHRVVLWQDLLNR